MSPFLLVLTVSEASTMLAQGPSPSNSTQQVQGSQSASNPAGRSNATGTISESQLAGLPLNGRSYSQLATLEAGVSGGGGSGSRGIGSGELNFVGGRSLSNVYLMDGINIQSTQNQAPQSAAGVQLGGDAVMQVQVLSGNYGADMGRGSGGVLNSISRSGSNEFHGNFFEYFRNSKLDARDFFTPDSEPPPFKRNQYGFILTGPILSDKTYFMGSFEALRDRLTTIDSATWPDSESRLGIITDRNGKTLRTVTLPPAVKPYLELYPIPTGERLGEGAGEHLAPQFEPADDDFFTVRIDHQLTERDGLFFRYTFDDASSKSASGAYLFYNATESRQQYATLVMSHIFSVNVLNAFRMGYTRPVTIVRGISDIELPSSLFFVPSAGQFGRINVSRLSGFGPPNNNTDDFANTFQFANDMVVQKGIHGLKFGLDLHRYRMDIVGTIEKSGSWSFNSLDGFLQGGPSGTNLEVALPKSDSRRAFRQTFAGLYIQDQYRAKPNLQFNLGLRYEFATIIKDKYGKTHFIPDPVRDSVMQVGPMFKSNQLHNFSPRIGIAWSPGSSRNTSISAGFGIYYDLLLSYAIWQQRSSAPFYRIALRTNFDSTETFPRILDAAAEAKGTDRVRAPDYNHMTSPMLLRYNLGLQQQVAGGWRFQASYVGQRGNHLLRTFEANQYPYPIVQADGSLFFPPNAGPINPAFSEINLLTSDAQSFYNSLQLSVNKSQSGGLGFGANYTLSKSVDDSSSYSGGGGDYGWDRTLGRGLSNFDGRHRLSVNYFYTLPFGSGQSWLSSGTLAALFGGWRLGGIVSFRTGGYGNPSVNVRIPGYLFSTGSPNLLPGQSNNPVKGVSIGCETVLAGTELRTKDLFFDPCVFGNPAPGTIGNVGRNTLSGPNSYNLDVSMQKEFSIDSKWRLQFRGELFNVLNHTNFGRGNSSIFAASTVRDPVTGQTRTNIRRNPTAGRINTTSTNPRQIQFALRLIF
ncbi:MAG: hypothetical protein A3F68_05435 [Acidobacteria bacterium RIFCSPLOWO2_12_FULL_54_10]|nr:MAG: hypothetical protein A3F68_05435 [Acidobacteria bacterium RIFCSPLOWO2_12_FULL_54_10]